jgi:hypothetical protein
MTSTMVTVPSADDTAQQMNRMVKFAAAVTELADERRDIELRNLIDELHADLMRGADDDE